MNQTSSQPTAKVYAATVGAALATIVIWIVQQAWGVITPPLIQGAINVVFVAAATGLAGYIKAPNARDSIETEVSP